MLEALMWTLPAAIPVLAAAFLKTKRPLADILDLTTRQDFRSLGGAAAITRSNAI